jgi:hypothetical protein
MHFNGFGTPVQKESQLIAEMQEKQGSYYRSNRNSWVSSTVHIIKIRSFTGSWLTALSTSCSVHFSLEFELVTDSRVSDTSVMNSCIFLGKRIEFQAFVFFLISCIFIFLELIWNNSLSSVRLLHSFASHHTFICMVVPANCCPIQWITNNRRIQVIFVPNQNSITCLKRGNNKWTKRPLTDLLWYIDTFLARQDKNKFKGWPTIRQRLELHHWGHYTESKQVTKQLFNSFPCQT